MNHQARPQTWVAAFWGTDALRGRDKWGLLHFFKMSPKPPSVLDLQMNGLSSGSTSQGRLECQPAEGEVEGQETIPQMDAFLGSIIRGLVREPCF